MAFFQSLPGFQQIPGSSVQTRIPVAETANQQMSTDNSIINAPFAAVVCYPKQLLKN